MAEQEKKIKCPDCGIGFLRDVATDYETSIKDGSREINITVNSLKRKKCSHCGKDYLDEEALDRIQIIKYQELGLLTPEELKIIREKLKLTQEEISNLLGVGRKSYFRWENGLSIQNKSIDRYIRLVNENPSNISILKELQKQRIREYDEEKVAQYVKDLQSLEQPEEELLACVGHETRIPSELQAKVESVIKKHKETFRGTKK